MTLPETLEGRLSELLSRLDATASATGRKRPTRGHGDSYTACCPAHDDKNPSLAIRLEGDRVLLHCFAGCQFSDITGAVGMPQEAMFRDYRGEPENQPRINWNGDGAKATAAAMFHVEHSGTGEAWDEGPKPLPPTIQEFLEFDFPPIQPLLGPIATQQLVLLYAPPGAGKTMFQLGMSYALASGQDFVGWRSHRRARVLVIDGEMAGEMMQKRLAAAGVGEEWLRIANLANWGATAGYGPLNLATAEGQDTVNIWAGACGTDVIVLDNLMSLAWIDGISMNSDEFWQPIRRFCVWQRSMGRTVIVVDHTNKSGAIHGTGTKLWHADLAIEIRALEKAEPTLSDPCPTPRFSLRFSKVRGTPENAGQDIEEKAIEIGKVGQDWRYEEGREHKRQKAREMALNGLSVRDISDELGVSKSTAGRWVKGFVSK